MYVGFPANKTFCKKKCENLGRILDFFAKINKAKMKRNFAQIRNAKIFSRSAKMRNAKIFHEMQKFLTMIFIVATINSLKELCNC